MNRISMRFAGLALCAGLLAGCGGGQQDAVSTGAATSRGADAAPVTLSAGGTNTAAKLTADTSAGLSRKAAFTRVGVFRFFNTAASVHFYTTSVDEREQVYRTLTAMEPEGVAFYGADVAAPGLSPVHRFLNTETGVHFYTINEAERANVAANLPQFQYEGIAYYASVVPATGFTPLYRFLIKAKGVHFYTASETESQYVQANLSATYQYEGVGYYVMPDACASPPCGPVGPNRPRVFIPLTGNNDLGNNAAYDAQWTFVRQNAHGIWGNNAGVTFPEAANLIRKLNTRNMITEYPVPGPGEAWLPLDAFTVLQRLYTDIVLNPEAIAFYTDQPSRWNGRTMAEAEAIYTNPSAPAGQRFGAVYTGWQPQNFDGSSSIYLYANTSATLAYRSSKGTFIECPVNLCAEGPFGDRFRRAIREAHARERPFIWFTSNTSMSSGWLAAFQQTYNAIAAEGLWKPEDVVVIVNYGGTYPKVPEAVGGVAADTAMGLAYWAIQQRIAATP